MSKSYLSVREFAKALEEAGVIYDLDSITRVIIDLDPNDAVKVYVERIAGPELKQAAGLLGEMMRDGRATAADPGHKPGCNLRHEHKVPGECLHVDAGPAREGPVT